MSPVISPYLTSRLDTMDMTTDLSDTEAVEYCTCLSADVGEKDVKKVVEVVGGRFSDLCKACSRLKFFSVQYVLKLMYDEVAETVLALELVMPQDLKDEDIVLSIARKIMESSNQFITKAELTTMLQKLVNESRTHIPSSTQFMKM